MANNIYLSLTGAQQGLLSEGCSSYDSIGNAFQTAHLNEIMVYELAYAISRDQNVNHQPLTFKKPIDKSSPLLASAISNNEKMEAIFETYRTDKSGIQMLFYRIKLIKATIADINLVSPNSLTHHDAQPIETVSLKYESITWEHIRSGTSGYSLWEDRVF
ncbi:type VI secretion system Hcp family effector [Buttiauxella sp. BIGb0471]|uniref:Hcp family type VI secretion system effector n=1 Tax=Buttiauxella sp. BIGb0471 TaxID=2940597 RepID=UPI0021692075|nr:Hcp family type VI secretion system effector [Buttiauxella sp. BIGb0471]MCS3602364.1 type VI secretion system Hcp family effector [Buttiauxella sp. BIGb0471]